MTLVRYPYPIIYTAELSPSYTKINVLPAINQCPTFPTVGFVSELSASWNCNTCTGEKAYFSRYLKGDIIPFLVRLPDQFNADITNPATGWNFTGAANFYVKAQLYGAGVCPTPLYTDVNDFTSDFWVHYADQIGSYQVLFVDTSLLLPAEKNFRLHIQAYDSLGAITADIWSENFLEIDDDCTQYSILLEGDYDKFDCLGNLYRQGGDFAARFGTPPYHMGAGDASNYSPTSFTLRRRFLGEVILTGKTPENQIDDSDNIIQQKTVSSYGIYLQDLLPPYEVELFDAIIRSPYTTIDGIEYKNFAAFSRNLERGRMFFIKNLECQQVCTINNRVCD